jgi:hypothetical protein
MSSSIGLSARQHVVRELITTESAYIRSLNVMVDGFLTPLRRRCGTPDEVFTAEQVKFIFSKVVAIREVSRNLLSALLQQGVDGDVGAVLVKFAPLLRVYNEYLVDVEESISIVMAVAQDDGARGDAVAAHLRATPTRGTLLRSFEATRCVRCRRQLALLVLLVLLLLLLVVVPVVPVERRAVIVGEQ